jgi:hypothetical protein
MALARSLDVELVLLATPCGASNVLKQTPSCCIRSTAHCASLPACHFRLWHSGAQALPVNCSNLDFWLKGEEVWCPGTCPPPDTGRGRGPLATSSRLRGRRGQWEGPEWSEAERSSPGTTPLLPDKSLVFLKVHLVAPSGAFWAVFAPEGPLLSTFGNNTVHGAPADLTGENSLRSIDCRKVDVADTQ